MTKRTRILTTLATTSVAMLMLAGCAGGGGAATETSGEPVQGGTLSFGIPDDNGCIDPQQVSNNDNINIAKQTVASLTSQNPETGEVEPWLAQELAVNDDSTEFTFTLRTDATFADGSPIDAAAVKANFEAIQELGDVAPLGSAYLQGLSGIETPDESTVVFTFEQPSAQFLQATSTHSLGLLSVESLELDQAQRCAGEYVGSGPFTVESYTPSSGATLAGRDDYAWAPEYAENQGAPYLDTLEFTVIPESSTLTGALQSNQIDASANISALDQDVLAQAGYSLDNRANPGVVYSFIPNENHEVLGDVAVRQALISGIDRQALADLGTEADRPATSVLSDTTPNYSDVSELLAYDPAKSEQLLDDAGWEVGAEGIREKDGQPLTFTLSYWQPTADHLQLMQQQLRQIGVDMKLEQTTVADFFANLTNPDQHGNWANFTRADADALRSIVGPNAPFPSGLDNEAVLEPLLAQSTILEPEERQVEVDAAVEALIEGGHIIPAFQLSTTIVSTPTTHGIIFDGSTRLDFQSAWTE